VPRTIDADIDDLYKNPLDQFTAARNALAKTLAGDDAARVKQLAKPSLVAWSVNQVYWRARATFDRLTAAGERVRNSQIAALKGRSADVRSLTEAHRKAIADAVREATRLATAAGSSPNADELARTFEALSLAAELPEPPGRLTRALQPAGFEALVGVPRSALINVRGPQALPASGLSKIARRPEQLRLVDRDAEKRATRENEKRDRAIAQAEGDLRYLQTLVRRSETDLKQATDAVEQAKAVESKARAEWERAKERASKSEAALERMRKT
jgi:hypothetical protein